MGTALLSVIVRLSLLPHADNQLRFCASSPPTLTAWLRGRPLRVLLAVMLSPLIRFFSRKKVVQRDRDPVRARRFQKSGNVPARNCSAPYPALGHARIFEIHRAGQSGITAETGDDLLDLHTPHLRVARILVNVERVEGGTAC